MSIGHWATPRKNANQKKKKKKKMEIFHIHSVSALSKKVEDHKSKELDVRRKGTVFKSLQMLKIKSFLVPFTWLR